MTEAGADWVGRIVAGGEKGFGYITDMIQSSSAGQAG